MKIQLVNGATVKILRVENEENNFLIGKEGNVLDRVLGYDNFVKVIFKTIDNEMFQRVYIINIQNLELVHELV